MLSLLFFIFYLFIYLFIYFFITSRKPAIHFLCQMQFYLVRFSIKCSTIYSFSRWNPVFLSSCTLLPVNQLLPLHFLLNKNILPFKYSELQRKENMTYKTIETISIIYTWKCRHCFCCSLESKRCQGKPKTFAQNDWMKFEFTSCCY